MFVGGGKRGSAAAHRVKAGERPSIATLRADAGWDGVFRYVHHKYSHPMMALAKPDQPVRSTAA